jgi:hypothetical protein
MSPHLRVYLPALVLGLLACLAAAGCEGRAVIVVAFVVLALAVVVHTREITRRYHRGRLPYR